MLTKTKTQVTSDTVNFPNFIDQIKVWIKIVYLKEKKIFYKNNNLLLLKLYICRI
jgi:hypothetical protein